MALRYYRNGPARQLAFPIASPADTSMTVDSASGFPTQFPYTAIIEPDTALEEVVDVTAAVGNVLTIDRGVDSTTAFAHASGSTVYHGISARDAREANAHVNSTTGAHGTTGSIVDTDSAQTIVGAKNFTGGLSTPAGVVVTVGGVQTVTGRKIFDDAESTAGGDFVDSTSTQSISGIKTFTDVRSLAGGPLVATGGAQTVTGVKTFSGNNIHSGNNTFSGTNSHSNTETFTGDISVAGANITGAWASYGVLRKNGVSGSTLAVGNGTQIGLWKRIDKTVFFRILLTFGTTTNIGTDDYSFTLPTAYNEFHACGQALLGDASLGKFFGRTWHGVGSSEIVIVGEDGNRSSGFSGGSPIAWATGDTISICGVYEAA